ncbi:Serine/threonine-protein kinase OXI1 [Apostasia shenzhenica]|uniref:non-specific serine/threonine protein kinase n=1 Tax=Apostasia shenzhenica TaxID=1088818 RepID=A0A2I0AK49_9ASPA|nr:Serine/threonine-protein kinase OXI1 [Apostasia shenzhenica]
MADCNAPTPSPPTLELKELTATSVIGRGASGVAFFLRKRTSGETFALKALSRSSVDRRSAARESAEELGDQDYRRIWFERDVLLALRHPLLPRLRGVVTTEKIVGFAMEHCPGGDLNALRRRQTEKIFSHDIIRFYAAELVLVIDYLHKLGIVYRDLKPENIMIQENGHIMLIDFDLSTKLPAAGTLPETPIQKSFSARTNTNMKKNMSNRYFKCFNAGTLQERPGDGATPSPARSPDSQTPVKSISFVGTEEYMAPEIIKGKGHDFAVDWWCLGVVLYEMLYGRTPFRGQNRKETFYRIINISPEISGEPTALRDLIGRLLEKDPARRIGDNEIRLHEFFRGVDWGLLFKLARPPFIPVGAEWEEGVHGLDVEKIVEEASAKSPAAF